MLVHRRRPLISKPWSQSNRPGWRLKSGSPTTNPISIGSTVHGIPPIPIPTASIKARHGRHLKSNWTTDALWFSNTPDAAHRLQKTTAAKRNLGKAVRKAMFATNEFCRETSDSRQDQASNGDFSYRNNGHCLTETPPPPPFPPHPPFPRPPV